MTGGGGHASRSLHVEPVGLPAKSKQIGHAGV